MMAKKILILGAGFAGIQAARSLRQAAAVTLIDRHPYTTMIPSLPDLAGNRIAARYLTEDIRKMVAGNIKFESREIQHIDLNKRVVTTDHCEFNYDYLIIATGSVTNFFGFDQHLDRLYKLDQLEDGERISREFPRYLERADTPHAIVVGGGYTGLELACNLRYCSMKEQKDCRVSIVERNDSILGGLPGAIGEYIEQRCAERRIDLLTGRTVAKFDGVNAELSDGTSADDIFLCWSTGAKFGTPLSGNHETIGDGRIVVDASLRIPEHPEVYAAGDAAAISSNGDYLRRAVNFSIDSGGWAGRNVKRTISGLQAADFSAKDLGWVIPFCNVGAGMLFSKYKVNGKLPLALHYFMCGYRNYNLRNRLRYVKMSLAALTGLQKR